MSLPAALATRTLDAILADHPDLAETKAQTLGNQFGDVGELKVYHGTEVTKVVYIGLVVPQFHLDSHMVFAFTPPGSAVPHFTLDSVFAGEYYAFHLDLIPRLDLAANLSYIDEAFHPMTPVYQEAAAGEGLSQAAISPRQHALMSPWMLVHRATEAAFHSIGPVVEAYRAHWSELVHKGLSHRPLPGRDEAVRENLFSPQVDPVWAQVSRLLGEETTLALRHELIHND